MDFFANPIFTHKYAIYLAFKRKKILQYGTTRTNLEVIMLSEIRQSEKDIPYTI